MRSNPVIALAVVMGLAPMTTLAMQFSLSGDQLFMSGIINHNDHCKFLIQAANHPNLTTVVINSPGGDAWAGASLGMMFRLANVTAVVPQGAVAYSAAAIAVVAAPRKRILGSIAFHSPYLPKGANDGLSRADLYQVKHKVASVLSSSGVSDRDIDRIMAAPPNRLVKVVMETADGPTAAPRNGDRIRALADLCGRM